MLKICRDMCKWLVIAKRKEKRKKNTQIRQIFRLTSQNKRGQQWTLTIIHHHSHRQVEVLRIPRIPRPLPNKTCRTVSRMDNHIIVPLPLSRCRSPCCSCPRSLYHPLCDFHKDRVKVCYQGTLLPSYFNVST